MPNQLRAYKASIFQALSHPTRIAIVEVLRDAELSAGAIQEKLGIEQANLSQHLTTLRNRQIVVNRKEGNQVFYSLRNRVIAEVLDLMRRYCQQDLTNTVKMLDEANRESLRVMPLLGAGLLAYIAGAVSGLACWKRPATARLLACLFAVAGSLLQAAASMATLAGRAAATWTIPITTPLFPWTLRLDPLSAWFNLALAILALAVTVYSFGYLRAMERTRNLGAFGFLYNLLLLSLTLVFAAGNAFFFLTAWEVMTIASYCMVTFEHEKAEARRAAMTFFIMSHAGTGMLLAGFLLLSVFTGSVDFASFHLRASQLPAAEQGARVPAVLPRLRREGRDRSAAHLAARRAPCGAQQHFGADVRHRDQDGDLRDGARLFRFLRRAAVVDWRRGARRRRRLGAGRRPLRAAGARSQAAAGVPQHRKYRHHRHGLRRGADVPHPEPSGAGRHRDGRRRSITR